MRERRRDRCEGKEKGQVGGTGVRERRRDRCEGKEKGQVGGTGGRASEGQV